VEIDRYASSFLERFESAYLLEMRAFVDAIGKGAPVPVSGDAARAALLLARAAAQSFARKTPVRLRAAAEAQPRVVSHG
jgi:myo-inositol 2-dehydrogenase/D-chiro-inositol 1-dehydrogenase